MTKLCSPRKVKLVLEFADYRGEKRHWVAANLFIELHSTTETSLNSYVYKSIEILHQKTV